MKRSLSRRVRRLLILAAALLLAALVSGSPALAVMAIPLLVLLGAGLAAARQPRLRARVLLQRDRVLEGDLVEVTLRVTNLSAHRVELELDLEVGDQVLLDPAGSLVLGLAGQAADELVLQARPRRWGAHRVGPLRIRARDPLGLVGWRGQIEVDESLRVFPGEQSLRALIVPGDTQPFLGAHVARARGQGVEFADLRPFRPGDRVREINWRATARRGTPFVTERSPERAGDVVLLVDTFEQARALDRSSLDDAVRATASLARAMLAGRDRVALLDLGGTLHWLAPGFGARQLYRIMDALLASEAAFSYAWRAVESIPRRVLPSGALILAITPLLDERSIALLVDLRNRGYDLALLEVSPLDYVTAGASSADRLAFELWELQRDAMRARLRALEIAVATWHTGSRLELAVEEVNRFRRFVRSGAHA